MHQRTSAEPLVIKVLCETGGFQSILLTFVLSLASQIKWVVSMQRKLSKKKRLFFAHLIRFIQRAPDRDRPRKTATRRIHLALRNTRATFTRPIAVARADPGVGSVGRGEH